MSVKTADAPGPSPGADTIGPLGEARATARAAGNHIRSRTASQPSAGGIRMRAAGSIQQVVVVAVTLFIGIFVVAQISEAMPSLGADNAFNGTMSNVGDIINSSFVLAGVVPIVIIAGALLFYVRNFQGGSGGRRR